MQDYGSKVKLLAQFTAVLKQQDPMKLGSPREEEYEPEALSILARFSESGFHLSEERDEIIPFATGIVVEVMKFWFSSVSENDDNFFSNCNSVATRLVEVYLSAWPSNNEENR